MTVKELIEHLQTFDPELRVFSNGYEGGLDDVTGTSQVIHVDLNQNTEWYYGEHEKTNHPTEKSVKGIII
jgi:hypothetical protein